MVVQYFALALSSFLIGEILAKLKLRVLLAFQGLETAKMNLRKLANKISKKSNSGIIFSFGKRFFNMHHSRFGWALAGVAVVLANLSLLSFSSGFIIHHLIREKSLF